ncbi:MAG TPA: alpha/beta fold hydrolase [Allosphingosinicella sp.]|jgi:predicted esterase
MTDFLLHGFGSSAALFRKEWEPFAPLLAPGAVFLDGFEAEALTGHRRWFPFSGVESRLAAMLAESADRVEAAIAGHLRTCPDGDGPIRLFGHSQGGMLALDLACRGSLPIAAVHSFAAYLPAGGPPRRGTARHDTIVHLHSSEGDQYIRRGQVRRTVERLRDAGISDVRDRVAARLPHAFSAAWVEGAAFAEASQ